MAMRVFVLKRVIEKTKKGEIILDEEETLEKNDDN